MNKKGALDLSIGTIVIIVIGVTMLILGIVLVRSIMCSAIGLTDSVGDKASAELDRYFGENGGEIACIGSVGSDPVKLRPGDDASVVYCLVKASKESIYEFKVIEAKSYIPSLKDETLSGWIVEDSWGPRKIGTIDNSIKPVARILIPETAPEGTISLSLEIKRDGEVISSPTLDFTISRSGMVQNVIC